MPSCLTGGKQAHYSDAELRALLRAATGQTSTPSDHWSGLCLSLGSERIAQNLVLASLRDFTDTAELLDRPRMLREADIVLRNLIGNEPDREIARALGIPLRQYYRERKSALQRLASTLARNLKTTLMGDATVVSLFGLRLSEAQQAYRLGNARGAVRLFNAMLDHGVPRKERYRVLANLSIAYAMLGQRSLAERAYLEANRAAPQSVANQGSTTPLLDFPMARLAADAFDIRKLREIAQSITNGTRELAGPDLEAVGYTLCEIALFEITTANASAAASTLLCADEMLAQHDNIPADLRARLLTLRSQLHLMIPESIALGRMEGHAALKVAQQFGLVREGWYALHTLVDHHNGTLTLRSVLAYGHHLMKVARTMNEPHQIVLASLLLSATEAQLGNVTDSSQRLESCRSLCSASTIVDHELLEAYILLRKKRYNESLLLAASAHNRADRLGLRISAGVGLIYEAYALEMLGHRRKALRKATLAAELLEGSGSPYHLASAYGRLYSLTGNGAFQRSERALKNILRTDKEPTLVGNVSVSESYYVTTDFSGALTPRQTEIALLASVGRTNRQIAHQLGISESTTAHHVEAILRRLGLRGRWQLVELHEAGANVPQGIMS